MVDAERADAPARTPAPETFGGASVAEDGTGAASSIRIGRGGRGESGGSTGLAASRLASARWRASTRLSAPRSATPTPPFAPEKSARKIERTSASFRTSPTPTRIANQATAAPMPVSICAEPEPSRPPIIPPLPGRRISINARSAAKPRAPRSTRRSGRLLAAARRSTQTPVAISSGGRSQRPPPNHGAITSRSVSAMRPRPGRIRPIAKMTPVTARPRKISVR